MDSGFRHQQRTFLAEPLRPFALHGCDLTALVVPDHVSVIGAH